MESLGIVIATAGLIMGCYWLRKRRAEHGPPLPWPLVGMVPYWIMHHSHIYDWITEILTNCGGTFVFQGPSLNTSGLFTSNPDNVEHILKTKFISFRKPPVFTNVFRDLLGHGILNVDEEPWTVQRRVAVAEFNSLSSLNYVLKLLHDSVAGRLIRILDAACSECKAIDLQEVFQRFTFDNVSELVIGVPSGCLSDNVTHIPFARAFEKAIAATVLRMLFFVMPTFLWKFIGIDVRLQKELNTINKFVANIILSRQNEFNRTEQKLSERRADLLSTFVSSRDEKGEVYSEKYLRDICFNFLLAGRDKTSVALSWFFWLLNQHPDVERNILREINAILEQRSGFTPKSLFASAVRSSKGCTTCTPASPKPCDFTHHCCWI